MLTTAHFHVIHLPARDFIQRDVGRVANSALGRAARNGVLHAIAGEHLQPPVVQHHRNMHGISRADDAAPSASLVQPQPLRGFVEASFGRKQRIKFCIRGLRYTLGIDSVTMRSEILRTYYGTPEYHQIVGRILIALGALLIVAGAARHPRRSRLPMPVLGRLPGDIVIRGKNGAFYFPIVTCIVISIVLSLLLRLLRR